jgi:hypothetical protein
LARHACLQVPHKAPIQLDRALQILNTQLGVQPTNGFVLPALRAA